VDGSGLKRARSHAICWGGVMLLDMDLCARISWHPGDPECEGLVGIAGERVPSSG
jgi:hypothetical protein